MKLVAEYNKKMSKRKGIYVDLNIKSLIYHCHFLTSYCIKKIRCRRTSFSDTLIYLCYALNMYRYYFSVCIKLCSDFLCLVTALHNLYM
jgi:hypothetical protein